jgi:hypothetical protein
VEVYHRQHEVFPSNLAYIAVGLGCIDANHVGTDVIQQQSQQTPFALGVWCYWYHSRYIQIQLFTYQVEVCMCIVGDLKYNAV